uniref:HAD domain-containing protein n=1 Tax=Flavobacterium sp. TaxID=239 RepID=UPI00404A0FBF
MLILLDIDGVMVPIKSWKAPAFLNDGFPAFSSMAVQSLQKIISATNADILLTTSHKSRYSIDEWKDIFKNRGLEVNQIYRMKENTSFLNRKDEIMNWVHATDELPNFIILDDDKSLNGLPSSIKSKLIQTDNFIGLTDELADEALKLIAKDQSIFS